MTIAMPGGATSVPLAAQRAYLRDLACVLWQLFEFVPDIAAKQRPGYLKMIALDSEGPAFVATAVESVLEQTKELPDFGLRKQVNESGVRATARHLHYSIKAGITKVDALMRLLMLPTWAEYGFPTVQIGHKLAATLLVTRVSEDVLADIQLPWPVFEIELPTPLLTTPHQGVEYDLGFMHVGITRLALANDPTSPVEDYDRWAILASAEPCTVWSVKNSLTDLGELLVQPDNGALDYPDATGRPMGLKSAFAALESTDSDERTLKLLARLLANVALLMTENDNLRAIGKAHQRPRPAGSKNRRCPFPIARTFQITTPVRHDFRDVVREYVKRGGRTPSVQGVVTGHWKMQVHGQGRTQRKRIFVHPYWRGDESAPIALRPHKLGDPV